MTRRHVEEPPVQSTPTVQPTPEDFIEKFMQKFGDEYSREDVTSVVGSQILDWKVEDQKSVILSLQELQQQRLAQFSPEEEDVPSENEEDQEEEQQDLVQKNETAVVNEEKHLSPEPVVMEQPEYEAAPAVQPVEEPEPEPEPAELTWTEKFFKDAKELNLMSESSRDLLKHWTMNVATSDEFRKVFNQSSVLRDIITSLLEVSFSKEIPCRHEVEELFHEILQGNGDYHAWLFGQLRKLAEYITKSSPATEHGAAGKSEFQKFLAKQAFDIVNAQKKQNEHQNMEMAVPQERPNLPSREIDAPPDEKMQLYVKEADRQCLQMWNTFDQLQHKDASLKSMNPTSNQSFTERYQMVQKRLENRLQQTSTEVQVHTTTLERINQRWGSIENTMKERVLPIENQLEDIRRSKISTSEEIVALQHKLARAKEALEQLDTQEIKLSNEILMIKTEYAPESKSLNRERSDVQFKLHAVHRQRNCFTHLCHITTESYKHLESWSRSNISKEKDSRSKLLRAYFQSVESYTIQHVKMLDLLGRRVKWMQNKLAQLREDQKAMKNMYGGHLQQEAMNQINQNQARMEKDKKSIRVIENEIKVTLQKCCNAAFVQGAMGGVQDSKLFFELYNSLKSNIANYDVDLSRYVNLPAHIIPGVAQASMEPARPNQPLHIIPNAPSLTLNQANPHYPAAAGSMGHVGHAPPDAHDQRERPHHNTATAAQLPRKPPVTGGQYMGMEYGQPAAQTGPAQPVHDTRQLDQRQHDNRQIQEHHHAHPAAQVIQPEAPQMAPQNLQWSKIAQTNGHPRSRRQAGRGFKK